MKSPLFILSIQIAYFLGSINLSDKLKAAETIKSQITLLDGSPTILPIPDNAPAEIPRISLISKDQQFVCNLALNRFDFIHKLPDSEDHLEAIAYDKQLNKRIIMLNKILFTDLKASSYRLGLIVTYRYYPTNGGLEFLKKCALPDPRDKAAEVQLHELTLESINYMRVNNWVRIIANSKLINGKNPLLVVSDVNTLQTEKYNLDDNKAKIFFKEALDMSIRTTIRMIIEGN